MAQAASAHAGQNSYWLTSSMRDAIANRYNVTLRALVLCTEVILAAGLNTGHALLQVSDVPDGLSSDLKQLRFRDSLKELASDSRSRWRRAMTKTTYAEDTASLQESIAKQEEQRLERRNVEGANSCSELVCGDLGYCDHGLGSQATCRCQAGYEGNGLVCNPPANFVEHALIAAKSGAAPPQVTDLHVSTLSGRSVAVTFRDTSRQNGFIVIGDAHDGGMRWGPASLIGEQVFGPVTAELPGSGLLAMAYRTKDVAGDGVLRCVRREPDRSVIFGKPYVFANLQAQAMSLVGMPQSRVAVLFAEHLAQEGKAGAHHFEMHGSSILAELSGDLQAPKLLGKSQFADGPVSRISVAPLSPTLFAVAFREGQDSEAAPSTSREASVALAELWDSSLVFTMKPIPLEPSKDEIWARSVAGLGNNAFAYTYHSGTEQVTKQAVLRLDPESHKLVILQEPQVIAFGFTPFVSTVGTVQQEEPQMASQVELLQSHGHRLFTFLGAEGAHGQGTICAVSQGLPVGCKNSGKTFREVVSATSAPVGDGRVFLLSVDAQGSPYYSLVGLLGRR